MKHRFEVLDIFRGLFAFFVFLFHLAAFAETPLLNNPFVENSDIFVDFFFVLSGFVIAYRYELLTTTKDLVSFYRKRFFRLYPLHLAMLLVFLGMESIKKGLAPYVKINQLVNPHNSIETFVSSFFLLNSTPIDGAKDVSWNIPSWSISAEMLAYLLFGVVVFVINAGQSKQKNWAYGGVVLLGMVSLFWLTGGFELNYSFNYGFLRGIIGFFTGVLCLNLYRTIHATSAQLPGFLFSIAEIGLLVLLSVAIYLGEVIKPWGLLYEPLFFTAVFIFAFEKGIVSTLLRKSLFLHNLGKYSYSIYLTHAFVLSAFNVLFIRILHFPPSAYAYLFIPNFALTYAFSAWTYRTIEMRFQRYGQKKKVPTPGTVKQAAVI